MKRFGLSTMVLVAAVGGIVLAAGTIPELLWDASGGTGGAVAALPDGSAAAIGPFGGTAVFGPGEPNETTLVSTPGENDYFVARYGPDGLLAWARRIGGPGTTSKEGIAAFDDDSVVVTGNAGEGVTIDDPGSPGGAAPVPAGGIWLARYDAGGTLVWVRRGAQGVFEGTTPSVQPSSIASFPDGSFVVCGAFSNAWGDITFGEGGAAVPMTSFDISWDVFVAKYDAAGTLLWVRKAGEWSGDWAYYVDGFADGSCVVVGENFLGGRFGVGEADETDLPAGSFVARYGADGTLAWARALGAPLGSVVFSVAALPDDSSVVVGTFLGSMTLGAGEPTETTFTSATHSFFIARYDASGGLLWARSTTGDAANRAAGVTPLADGTIAVVGDIIGTTALALSVTFGEGEACETTLVKPAGWGGVPFIARYAANGDFVAARTETGYFGGNMDSYDTGAFVLKANYGVRYYAAPVAVVPPDPIVQECDDHAHSATVFFTFKVIGTPPVGSTIHVVDTTGSLGQILGGGAFVATYGVGPLAFPMGLTVMEIEIRSAGGEALVSASFTVQIEDTTPPALTGCTDVTIECQGCLTPLFKSLLGLSVSDNCDPAPTVEFSPAAVGLGPNNVMVTARDATGNTSSCDIVVTVVDTTTPVFEVCPGDIERECEGHETTICFDVLASDLCGDVTLSCADETGRAVDPAGTPFAVGTHTVTCTATDSSGNRAVCEFSVTITDNTAPVIVCPADITVGNLLGECFAFVDFEVTATDLCDPDFAIVCRDPLGNVVVSGDLFVVGTTTITCTATDTSGKEAMCSFNITVVDAEAPNLECPAAATLVTDCAGSAITPSPADLGISATDNCDLNVQIELAPATLSPGLTSVLVTASDDDGNGQACSVAVTVLKGPFHCSVKRPLDGNVDNRITRGQTVPVKVRAACDNVFVDDATVTLDALYQVDANGTPIGNEMPEDAGAANDNDSLFRLDADNECYAYNLSTKGWASASGARHKVVVRIAKAGHMDTLCEIFFVNR